MCSRRADTHLILCKLLSVLGNLKRLTSVNILENTCTLILKGDWINKIPVRRIADI